LLQAFGFSKYFGKQELADYPKGTFGALRFLLYLPVCKDFLEVSSPLARSLAALGYILESLNRFP
jgi:hypothetical protein